MRRSGLGRGLGALIPNEVVGDRSSPLLEIPVVAIRANPHQPRTSFDEEAMASLTASVREVGILQPVLVRGVGESAYELIAGERRWRAAKRAGLPTIPALVRESSDVHSVEQALVENLHRLDLNPLEEAGAYQQLIEDFGLTHEQLSSRVGKSRVAITNMLRLFQLPPSVQKLVSEGQLTAGHARALLGTPDRAFQESLARRAVAEQLSVRAVEEAVRDRNELGEPSRPANRRPLDPAPASRHPRTGGTALQPSRHPGKGQCREPERAGSSSSSPRLEDLERIYRVMTEPSVEP